MTSGEAHVSRRAPPVHADVVVAASVTPGTVYVSRGLLRALRVEVTRTVSWVEPPRPDTDEERLLRAIFGGNADPVVTVHPLGPVRRGDVLVKSDFGQLTFTSATSGFLLGHEVSTDPAVGDSPARTRHLLELRYLLPAGPGDVVIDANGTRAHVAGLLDRVDHPADTHDPVLGAALAALNLDALDLAVETRAALERCGTTTVAALVRRTSAALQTRAALSAAAITAIEAALADLGLSLAPPPDESDGESNDDDEGERTDDGGDPGAPLRLLSAVALVPPLTLATPTVAETLVARSIGPYAIGSERPLDAARITRAQRHALQGVAPALAEEVAWRSDNPHGRLRLFEDIFASRDPRGDAAPRPTRALENLRASMALLGFGFDIEGRGLRFVTTHLGTQPRPHVPPIEPLSSEDSTASPSTTAGASAPSDLSALSARASQRALRGDEAWSHGALDHAATLDPAGLPVFGGLFCQRIFGPINDFACACRQRVPKSERGSVCRKCGVEVVSSGVRAQRFGHIRLAHPIVPWPWCREDELLERGYRDPAALRDAPAWHVLPVIPPDLRPIIKSPRGFEGHLDINDLYVLVWQKNEELAQLSASDDPVLLIGARRGLQQAVDALLLSGLRDARSVVDHTRRPLGGALVSIRSSPLRDTGVDYAARTTVVMDARLTGRTLAVGAAVAGELWKYQVLSDLTEHGRAPTVQQAKTLLGRDARSARTATLDVVVGSSVLCAAHERVCGARVVDVDPGAGVRVSPELMSGLGLEPGEAITLHVPLSRASAHEAALLTAREAPPIGAAQSTKPGFLSDLVCFLEERASLDDLSALLLEQQGVLDTTSEELGGLLVTGLR